MQRVPEPELMDEQAQAAAYAHADFAEPHQRFVALFQDTFPGWPGRGCVLDLGCGPADITVRFACAYSHCTVHGVDGAGAMLAYGEERVRKAGLAGRIALIQGYLPGARLPQDRYDAIISNSLLHHLRNPSALWETVRRHARAGAPVFVMDLVRPASEAQARMLVDLYAAGEPDILRRDFYHSLRAAYEPDEVLAQLSRAGLAQFHVRQISDRHLLVSGYSDAIARPRSRAGATPRKESPPRHSID